MIDSDYDIDDIEAEARLAALPSSQRAVVEALLEERPNYRYDLDPPIYPPPRPGLPSALAAVAATVGRIKNELAETSQ